MLHKFRHLYPQGSLLSELVNLEQGLYVVKVTVKNQDVVWGSGLAAAETVEKAEDQARIRALMTLFPNEANQATTTSRLNILNTEGTSTTTSSNPTNLVTNSLVNDSKHPNGQSFNPGQIHTGQAGAFNNQTTSTVTNPELTQQQNSNNSDSVPQTYGTTDPSSSPTFILENQPESLDLDANSPAPSNPAPSETSSQQPAPLNIFNQPLNSPAASSVSSDMPTAISEPQAEISSPIPEEVIEFDFNEIKYKIDLEMKRLGWTSEQGRDYLLSTYGKRSRLHLKNEEIIEFWRYLEALP